MLMVSRFNSSVRGQQNQNICSDAFRKIQFQSKPDSVFFTSKTRLAKNADKKVINLTDKFLNKYPDVFGANFEASFLSPMKEFFAKKGIEIKSEGSSKSGTFVSLAKLNGEEHKPTCWVSSPTKNEAIVGFFVNYLTKVILKNTEIPEPLKLSASKIDSALSEFEERFSEINHGITKDKYNPLVKNNLWLDRGIRYQKALSKLMPES